MLKYLYYILASIILVFLQQTILPNLGFLNNLNVILVSLVFITIISGFNIGFIFAMLLGLLFNIYSFLPLGTFIIIYLIICLIVNFLYKNVFINFSFLTNLILIIIATFLYSIFVSLSAYLFYLMNLSRIFIVLDQALAINFIMQLLLNSLLISLIFILAKLTIKKLNLVFLIKK